MVAEQSAMGQSGGLTAKSRESRLDTLVGGHSSMVESKLVELVVAGSNPVGHPTLPSNKSSLFPV
jgi:hypothetical protein